MNFSLDIPEFSYQFLRFQHYNHLRVEFKLDCLVSEGSNEFHRDDSIVEQIIIIEASAQILIDLNTLLTNSYEQ